jgi:glutamyl-tRNA synthetase/glutamyl-Q tRNA(Asp) synthetase
MLHMGHAVNAVYVWSIARAFGGAVVVRIEDHDVGRSRPAYADAILSELEWLGLHGDNDALGLRTPVRQREDLAPYHDALAALAARDAVYACRCSRRDIAAHSADPLHEELHYPGTCRSANVPWDDTAARRVRLPDDPVRFDDLRHGLQIQQPAAQCGDVLVRDRLGHWTYQFAVTIDDLRQSIDLVIRGDDLLASTGRQIMIGALLDRPTPIVTLHHPLIRRPDGAKLSKSAGDTGLAELRGAGWTASDVLGRAAWLGGLQAEPAPRTALELAALWTAST